MAPKILRAGWIQRESSFLKRWKESWFVLYRSGLLMYFEEPNSAQCEERVHMARDCLYVRAGAQVVGVAHPLNRTPECLLSLKLTSGVELNLCAQSPEDMILWHAVLEDARNSPRRQGQPPPPYPGHGPPAYAGNAQIRHVVHPQPVIRTQIVIQPMRRRIGIRPFIRPANPRRRSLFW